ncbi:MAG TPA: nuclear transport factor 2 family protein [Solirubrobacteraceae bacterium]
MSASGLATSPTAALRDLAACIERLDADGCAALMADDAVLIAPFSPAPLPNRIDGAAAIGATFRQIFGAFRSFAWVETEVHATDDPELAFMTARSEIKLANGGDYDQDYAMTARVRDGQIVEYCEYFDPIRAQRALA